ncbi:hypothetical protein [Persicitalea sp.]|uniref:hypothetical protein n=1 Tax=Persicitalea sp. TaxID=3100273 RepID=UPI0035943F74
MKTKKLADEITNVLEEKLLDHVHDAKKLKKVVAKESEKLAKKISKFNRKGISTKQDPSEKAVKSSKKGKKLSAISTSQK